MAEGFEVRQDVRRGSTVRHLPPISQQRQIVQPLETPRTRLVQHGDHRRVRLHRRLAELRDDLVRLVRVQTGGGLVRQNDAAETPSGGPRVRFVVLLVASTRARSLPDAHPERLARDGQPSPFATGDAAHGDAAGIAADQGVRAHLEPEPAKHRVDIRVVAAVQPRVQRQRLPDGQVGKELGLLFYVRHGNARFASPAVPG